MRCCGRLSRPDQVRVSYDGWVYGTKYDGVTPDISTFRLGVSYTDGVTVDIVRRGREFSSLIDHSTRTDNSRDLIFGENGIAVIIQIGANGVWCGLRYGVTL